MLESPTTMRIKARRLYNWLLVRTALITPLYDLLKTPKLAQEIFDSIQFGELFSNEIHTYNSILPALEQFTKEHLTVPKFLYSELHPGSATVVLQDFAVRGFRMSKELYNLSLDHILLAVKYLGNFHGIGFAMRQVKREQFDNITSSLRESRFGSDDIHPEWGIKVVHSVKRLQKSTHTYQPNVEEDFLRRFGELLSNYTRFGKQCVAPIEPMVTLCHGDYLRNNIAFKYVKNKEGIDVPTEVLMFDLQTMRVSSPMVDFSVLVGLSTFASVRHTHFKQIFDTYYDELAKTYAKYAKQPLPANLSRESFLQEYIRYTPYSINIAGFFLIDLVEPEDISSEDLLTRESTAQDIINDTMQRGGEVVDRELAHQVKEMYDLSQQYKVNIFEKFDWI